MPDASKSLKISPDLHRRLKIRAAELNVNVQQLAEIYIAAMLAVADHVRAAGGRNGH